MLPNFAGVNMLKNVSMNSYHRNLNDRVFAQRIIVIDKNLVILNERKNISPRYQLQRSSRPLFQNCPFYSKCQVMYIVLPNAENHFYLDANTIGRTKLIISISWWKCFVDEFCID